MILDRMTTLFQKTKSEIELELKNLGFNLSASDISSLLEEISPEKSRTALSYILNYIRPWTQGLGLRVVRLSDSQVEIVIPPHSRNKNNQNEIHIGTFVPAALEAAQIFWARHLPGPFDLSVETVFLKNVLPITSEVRLRTEFDHVLRESFLAMLRSTSIQKLEMSFQLYNEQDQLGAEILIQFVLKATPILNSTSQN